MKPEPKIVQGKVCRNCFFFELGAPEHVVNSVTIGTCQFHREERGRGGVSGSLVAPLSTCDAHISQVEASKLLRRQIMEKLSGR